MNNDKCKIKQEQSMVNIYLDGVHIYLSNYDVRSIYLVYFHPTKA